MCKRTGVSQCVKGYYVTIHKKCFYSMKIGFKFLHKKCFCLEVNFDLNLKSGTCGNM